MSMPKIPNITPDIRLDRDDVINILLASIAFEELALAHVINAEAEKLQSVLGTLHGQRVKQQRLEDLLLVNKSVNKILRDTIKKEMLLQFKLEDCLELIEKEDDDDEG
ncbi:hypothetical protein [Desulfuribacillus alkaliarsenatis]|uniref:Uncharacterized protein n=1 Tax=Desulfuribacillus alkaliarsenatis TaxID=766136 RepID=A0A1E5FZA8_9FIRM|nr:hypothetical protein [Desulfuribacillus alkaliarsenatis]OEF95566.1 hypothetical protein BHF68_11965 [Desulfuribacillus alkaliarsenatis]